MFLNNENYKRFINEVNALYSEMVEENEINISTIESNLPEDYEKVEKKFKLYLDNLAKKRNEGIQKALKQEKLLQTQNNSFETISIGQTTILNYIENQYNLCTEISADQNTEPGYVSYDIEKLYKSFNFLYKKCLNKYYSLEKFLNKLNEFYIKLIDTRGAAVTGFEKKQYYRRALFTFMEADIHKQEIPFNVTVQRSSNDTIYPNPINEYLYTIRLYEYIPSNENFVHCKIFKEKEDITTELFFDSCIPRDDASSNNYFVDFLIPYHLPFKVFRSRPIIDDAQSHIALFLTGGTCLKCGKPKIPQV
jgi:hypothetical protein